MSNRQNAGDQKIVKDQRGQEQPADKDRAQQSDTLESIRPQ